MISLRFLSPTLYKPGTLNSPMEYALHDADRELVGDLWLDCKIEVRGDLDLVEPLADEYLVRLTPRRGVLFTAEDPPERIQGLRAAGILAYDFTGALAGLQLRSELAMRRLTDLDLAQLPAAGSFARVPAIVLRRSDGWFRVYVAQELGHYVAEVVLDTLTGLENV